MVTSQPPPPPPTVSPPSTQLLSWNITVAELTTAADTVKAEWPTSVVYWNEAWAPVVGNSTYPYPASALHRVPASVDWISVDYYRETSDAWVVPRAAYASHIYPKMNSRQFALQVPQAFGKKTWSNADANSVRWWDEWSSKVAQEYFVWAQADPRIIGINPWYWGPDRSDISCGGYNVSITHLPAARAEWTKIGQTILASLNHSRVGLR